MMREATLQLFDLALTASLWIFLGVFLTILCLIALQSRSRQAEPAGEPAGPQEVDAADTASSREKVRRKLSLFSAQLQKAALGLFLALALGAACGLVLVFTPLGKLYNPSQGASLEAAPLRLTALSYERFYEGFSLRGEVWNQTHEAIQGVTARVYILGSGDQLLEEVTAPIQPAALPGRSPGTFRLDYRKNSPFLKGYRVTFESALGKPLPHVKGFNIE